MTDHLSISKQLAMAIGWPQILTTSFGVMVRNTRHQLDTWRTFDYTDWRVIGPIAQRYDCFPYQSITGRWASNAIGWHDTPQLAIAMTVISGATK